MATRYTIAGAVAGAVLGGAALLNIGTSTGTVAAGDDSRITGAVQASTLTTRGDLLRRGASAPERFAAVTADTFVGGDGTDVTVRTAAQVRASLGVVAPTRWGNQPGGDTTWTGWTLTNGVGTGNTVAVTGGALRFSYTTGTATNGAATAPFASVPLVARASPRAVRCEWIVVPVGGWDTSSDIIYGGLHRLSPARYWLARYRGDGLIGVWADQAVTDLFPGVETAGIGPPSVAATVWVAEEVSGGRVQYQYGTGTGTGGLTPPAPSEWKALADYQASTYTGVAAPVAEDTVYFVHSGPATVGTPGVVDLSAFTIIPLSPAVQ